MFGWNIAATVILGAISDSVKNSGKKKELMSVMLKIRDAINNLYAGSAQFERMSLIKAKVQEFKAQVESED